MASGVEEAQLQQQVQQQQPSQPSDGTYTATDAERHSPPASKDAGGSNAVEADVEYGLDQVLLELGSSGRFQIRIFALLLVPVVLFSMYEMTYLFTTGRLDYRYDIFDIFFLRIVYVEINMVFVRQVFVCIFKH